MMNKIKKTTTPATSRMLHRIQRWAKASRLVWCLLMLGGVLGFSLSSCHYDEEVEVCSLSVRLVYPEDSVDPYAGARVELKDALASVYVDSTDAQGVATFQVPPGIYEATSSEVHLTYDYRYIFNGVKSLIIVSPDSLNQVEMKLKMSKKRIVH